MCRRLININCKWCSFLSMEYGTNHNKHFGKSHFNHDLFNNRNKLQWLLGHGIGYHFCCHFTERYSDCIIFNNMCRRIININRERCNFLSMEYWSDNSEYYSKSNFNHYIFCNRNECKWMFGCGISNSFGQRLTECNCNSITRIYLPWWLKHTHREWRNFLSMEYGCNNCKYYSQPIFNDNILSHWNQL